MQKLTFLLALLALVVLGSACSTARKIVIRPGQGGTVAIANSEAARGRAESIMEDVCAGKRFRIVEERESVIGNVVEKSTDLSGDAVFGSAENRVAGNTTKKSREESFASQNEWRISFQCE